MQIENFLEKYIKEIKEFSTTDIRSISKMLKDKGFECYFVLDNELELKLKRLVKGTYLIVFEDYDNLELEEFLFDICEVENSFYKIGLDID